MRESYQAEGRPLHASCVHNVPLCCSSSDSGAFFAANQYLRAETWPADTERGNNVYIAATFSVYDSLCSTRLTCDLCATDNGLVLVFILLDLSAAFDTLDDNILVS